MSSCDKCGREIKNYGVFLGGVRCANFCNRRSVTELEEKQSLTQRSMMEQVFVIVQDYSDATDLFNSVELHGPFSDEDQATKWIDSLWRKNEYRHFTITTTQRLDDGIQRTTTDKPETNTSDIPSTSSEENCSSSFYDHLGNEHPKS